MKFKTILCIAALCLAAMSCTKEETGSPLNTDYSGVLCKRILSMHTSPVDMTFTLKDYKDGKITFVYPYSETKKGKVPSWELTDISVTPIEGGYQLEHEAFVKTLQDPDTGKDVKYLCTKGFHGTLIEGKLVLRFDFSDQETIEVGQMLNEHFFNCTPIEGNYKGTNTFPWPETASAETKMPDFSEPVILVVKDHKYSGKLNSPEGTCTLTIPMAHPFDLPDVKVTFEGGKYLFSHKAFEIGGYKNQKGLTGTLTRDGHIVLEYDAWPNGMKRPFDYTFDGRFEK